MGDWPGWRTKLLQEQHKGVDVFWWNFHNKDQRRDMPVLDATGFGFLEYWIVVNGGLYNRHAISLLYPLGEPRGCQDYSFKNFSQSI